MLIPAGGGPPPHRHDSRSAPTSRRAPSKSRCATTRRCVCGPGKQ
jgi:hypothetical protein